LHSLDIFGRSISLPMFVSLTPDQIDRVVDLLSVALGGSS